MEEKWAAAERRFNDHESSFIKYARAFRNWRVDVYETASLLWQMSNWQSGPTAAPQPTWTPPTPSDSNLGGVYDRNADPAYRAYMQGTFGGQAGRAFGEYGIPFAPDVNADAAMYDQIRDNGTGFLGTASEEESMNMADYLSDSIAEALETSDVLPESSMWSTMIDDLRESNTILRSIDGALQIIQRKDGDSTEVFS
jgi:hypothetical protein